MFGKDIHRLMVEYLLGEFDFYKVFGIDNKKITQIQSYNLRGTLNRRGKNRKRSVKLSMSTLPTRIVSLEYNQTIRMHWNYTLMAVDNLISEFIMLRLRLNRV